MVKAGVYHFDVVILAQFISDNLNGQVRRHINFANITSGKPVTHRTTNYAGFAATLFCRIKNMSDNITPRPSRQSCECAHSRLRC